ncbi:MAG: hypothetical protein WCE61_18455, partial [Candidatus Acidiferrum sp.]
MKRRISFVVTLALVLFVAFALTPKRQADGLKRFSMHDAYVQAGSPVRLNSVTHGAEFLFESTEVTNVSNKIVRSVTFGVLLHEAGPIHAEPTLAASREIATNIRPGQTAKVAVDDFTVTKARQKSSQLRSNRVVYEFGVLSVLFDDSSTWAFDWRKNGAFSPSGFI